MAKIVPIFDRKGFITDLVTKADQAMCNLYLTQRSQTDSFRGHVVSLADIIMQYGNNTRDLVNNTTTILQGDFDRQFEECTLSIYAKENGPGIDLHIDAILRDGNEQINLVHAVNYTNSKIKSIIDLQNQGKEIIPADTFG